MAGINRRPKFDSEEARAWFEATPKWVLYEILRDLAVFMFDSEEQGYDQWLTEAKDRQRILKLNRII
jgi:hypothetical protein